MSLNKNINFKKHNALCEDQVQDLETNNWYKQKQRGCNSQIKQYCYVSITAMILGNTWAVRVSR